MFPTSCSLISGNRNAAVRETAIIWVVSRYTINGQISLQLVQQWYYFIDIKIHFALREPHSRLVRANDASKLLIVTYAWDGNSLPGFFECLFHYLSNVHLVLTQIWILTPYLVIWHYLRGETLIYIFINTFKTMISFLQGTNFGWEV